ncbi:MAG TPA: hypothetical protein VIL46_08920 [Gemmataceae bacterium]
MSPSEKKPDPSDMVMTQAERVPPPEHGSATSGSFLGVSPQVMHEVQALAARVGGLDRLRQIVDTLISRGG